MTEKIPESIDLQWIARHIAALQGEVRALRHVGDAAMLRREICDLSEDIKSIRDHIDVTAMSLLRLERNQTATRDDVRSIFDLIRDLRSRLIEPSDGSEP